MDQIIVYQFVISCPCLNKLSLIIYNFDILTIKILIILKLALSADYTAYNTVTNTKIIVTIY